MDFIFLLRISSIILVVFVFLMFFRRLSKRSFNGSSFILSGILCMAVSWTIDFAFHGNILPKEIYSNLPPAFSSVASWVLLTCGLFLLITGVFRLYKSLVPQMDEYYSSLVEHSLVGVYLIQDSRFKYVNSRFAEILSKTHDELIGTPVLHIVADRDRKKVKTNIKKCLHAEVNSINHDFTAIKANGENVELEIFGNFTMHDGRPAIHGMVLDVSARKQALEIILAGEERFRSLANSSFDLIAETDPDGTILYLSANIRKILGYESYELINTNFFNILHPDDLTNSRQEFRDCIEKKESGKILYRCKNKKNEWQWMQTSIKPYITGSGESRVIYVGSDITEWVLRFNSKESKDSDSIKRTIEFKPQYFQAGLSILNYFGTVLRSKYPNTKAKVTIEQEELRVTMIIETTDGEQEKIEKVLSEYGLVIQGEIEPEDFVTTPNEIVELKNHLRLAIAQIENQKEILKIRETNIEELRSMLALTIQSQPGIHIIANQDFSPQLTAKSVSHNSQSVNLRLINAFSFFEADLKELEDELQKAKHDASEIKELVNSLNQLKDVSPEEARSSSAISKIRRFVKNLDDGNTAIGKMVKTIKNGKDIAQDLAESYNTIAQWFGLPQVPKPFLKKTAK